VTDDPTRARNGGDNRRDDGAAGDDRPSPHDAVGAFVLDALPEAERDDFAAHVVGCAACLHEVAALTPVVALLPRLLEVAPEYEGWVAGGNGDAALPAPSAGLRDRLLMAARADRAGGDGMAAAPAAGTGTRPKVVPVEEAGPLGTTDRAPGLAPVIPFRRTSRFGGGWPVAAALALVATGAVAWALTMQDRMRGQEAELAARRTEIAAERAASARAVALVATADGPSGAWGDLFYDPDDLRVMLHFDGLPVLPDDRAYQLWMLEGTNPIPSETFAVDAAGEKMMAMEADLSGYDAVALTVEPVGGSSAPTSAPILLGEMGVPS